MNTLLNYKKKANMGAETIIWLVILVVLGIVIVVVNMALTDINDDLQLDDDLLPETKEMLNTQTTNFSGFWDSMFLFALVLLLIVILISSFLIESHPAFFVIALILFFAVIIAGAMLSNSQQELCEDPELEDSCNQTPIINFVMKNLIQFIVVVGLLIALVLYAKNKVIG